MQPKLKKLACPVKREEMKVNAGRLYNQQVDKMKL